MQFNQVDFSAVAFSALQTNKGVKTANATLRGGPCEFLLHPTEWFTAPFGASTFDKDPQATRLTMEIDVTNSSILTLLQQMDQWAVQAVASSGLFENMSKEDVARMYYPCLQTSEKYNTIRLRTKLNTAGLHNCKWFKAPENTPVQFNELDLRTSHLRPVIQLKGIWKQSGQWGLSLECKKVLIDPQGTATWDF